MCVCEQEVTGSRSTATQNVLFLCKATAGRYIRDPTNTASKSASSRLKEAFLNKIIIISLVCGVIVCSPHIVVRDWQAAFGRKHVSIATTFCNVYNIICVSMKCYNSLWGE